MKKILKKTLTMMLILTLGMVKSSLATETKDMIPPEGNITITNSTITEGINYVDNLDVTLKISATDNVTTSANLKMYITTTPNANQIEILDEDWETYSTSKKITLPETKENIKIYAFFKDEAGNVSLAASFKVTQRAITVTAGSASRVYNGSALTNNTATVTEGADTVPPRVTETPLLAFVAEIVSAFFA